MRWYVADKGFVNYLNSIDSKVENIEYGNRLKPYFGIVLDINGINYYMPVSSAKDKHKTMKNSKDFQKIYDKDTGVLIAVLNINNMIPIPSKYITKLEYKQVGLCCKAMEDVLRNRYPRDISTSTENVSKEKADILSNMIKEKADKYNILMKNIVKYRSMPLVAIQNKNSFTDVRNKSTDSNNKCFLEFIPLSEYNGMENNSVSLKENEVLLYTYRGEIADNSR